MSENTFPTLSKLPDEQFYNEEYQDTAMRSKTEGGYVFTRPRTTRRPRRIFTTGYTNLPHADKETLRQFWDAMRGGSDAFLWTNPTTNEAVLVRFKSPLKPKYAGFRSGEHHYDIPNITLEEV